MAEYSKMAHGVVKSTGQGMPVFLPFTPDYVQLWNLTSAATPANGNLYNAIWNSFMAPGDAIIQVYDAGPDLTTNTAYPNGITPISAALALQYQNQIPIASISNASPAVVTTVPNHNYSTGDVVIFEGLFASATTGMPQICGIAFTVTVTGAQTFTIPWNTNQSNYTLLTGSPAGAYVTRLSYPYLYSPGISFIESITNSTLPLITTTTAHNLVIGQEIAFRIPKVWGMQQLNSLPNLNIPGSPIYAYVTSTPTLYTFTININTTNFNAFTTNVPVSALQGLSFPQVAPVGDVTTGGTPYSGGILNPSPLVNGF